MQVKWDNFMSSLGLTVGINLNSMSREEEKSCLCLLILRIAQITSLGFDYLRDETWCLYREAVRSAST